MRISNQLLLRDALRSLQGNLEALMQAQQRLATGRRIRTVSDSPADASRILRLESRIRDTDQFRRNSSSAGTRLWTEDAVLTSIQDLIASAKSRAVGASTADLGTPTRLEASAHVRQLRESALGLANTRIGGEYIFGGSRTTTPAFSEDGAYQGDDVVRQIELDTGVLVETNHTGDPLFSDLLSALDDLALQLETGTPDQIEESLTRLVAAEREIRRAQAEVGGRLARVEQLADEMIRRSTLLAEQRDNLMVADPTESAAMALAAQAALERAYEVIGRVLSIDLNQLLR